MTRRGEQIIDRLRFSDAARRKFLKMLDLKAAQDAERLAEQQRAAEADSAGRRGGKKNATPQRQYARLRVDAPNTIVELTQPSGASARFSVVPRNISTYGLGFIHGQFIHEQTRVNLALPARGGELVGMTGLIVRCRHVTGLIHEVGVMFDEPVDVRRFVAPEEADEETIQREQARAFAEKQEDVEARTPLSGEVLVVECRQSVREGLARSLREIGLNATLAANPDEADQAIRRGGWDVAIVGRSVDQTPAADLIRRWRDGGLAAPIFVLAPEGDPKMEAEVTAVGGAGLIDEAIDPRPLRRTLSAILQPADIAPADETIHSQLADDENMRPMIEQFVEGLTDVSKRMERSLEREDFDSLSRVVTMLKSAGESYGYPQVREAFEKLESLLGRQDRDEREVKSAVQTVNELLKMIRV